MLTIRENLLIILAILIICLIPFWLVSDSGQEVFSGADGQAEELVADIAPGYEPWFNSIFEPPSGEIETLLFSLQAALGAGVIGYYVGYNRGKRKGEV